MKTIDITKMLPLHETEGWQFIPFTEGKETSFYTTMIENNEIPLAWVALRDKIKEEDLIPHHFVREENAVNENFKPRVLIVTNGSEWYISRVGSAKFFKTSYSLALMILHNNIRACLNHYRATNANEKRINNLVLSLDKLKKRIKIIGQKQNELSEKTEEKLFANAEPDIDDSYKAMHEVSVMRSKVLEKMLESKSVEAHDYAIILHFYLSKTLNIDQIKMLLKIRNAFVYINPWYKGNQIIFKIHHEDIYKNRDKRRIPDTAYLILQPSGDVKKITVEAEDAARELSPGFFKLNQKMLRELYTRK